MILGDYELLEEIGRGGFGIVYKAWMISEVRTVAVKVLHANLVNIPGFVERFKREAKFAMSLLHDNIIHVFDFGQEKGYYYIAMDYMKGGSLSDFISNQDSRDENQIAKIFDQIANGVEFAHSQGIIHRDLKPGNVLFDEHGNACISDLGFAKAHFSELSMSLSVTGGMIGTPNYMAPELWEGREATPKSDQYSLGCILYEMLTGLKLFDGETTPTVMLSHFQAPVFADSISEDFRKVVQKATQKNPDDRYETLDDMRVAIARLVIPNIEYEASHHSFIELGTNDSVTPYTETEWDDYNLPVRPPDDSDYTEAALAAEIALANELEIINERENDDEIAIAATNEKRKRNRLTLWLLAIIGLLSVMLMVIIIFLRRNTSVRLGNEMNATNTVFAIYETEQSITEKTSQTPTNTLTNTVTLSKTATNTPTRTKTEIPTKTPTRTPTKEPTATPWPTNTWAPPTNTWAPPTNTWAPPTNTPAPPTNTLAPPTGTPPPDPIVTREPTPTRP
jgi:serine/threonine protein kinase